MTTKITLRGVASGIRRHPGRAAAVAVPLLAASVLTGTTMASATPAPTLRMTSSSWSPVTTPDR